MRVERGVVTLIVSYVFPADRLAEAETHLRALVEPTRAEPGCRTYELSRSKDDPRAFVFFEQYEDDAALEAHRASDHFARHGKNGIQPLAESRVATLYEPFA